VRDASSDTIKIIYNFAFFFGLIMIVKLGFLEMSRGVDKEKADFQNMVARTSMDRFFIDETEAQSETNTFGQAMCQDISTDSKEYELLEGFVSYIDAASTARACAPDCENEGSKYYSFYIGFVPETGGASNRKTPPLNVRMEAFLDSPNENLIQPGNYYRFCALKSKNNNFIIHHKDTIQELY